jgi:hypothetical protein
MTPAEAVIAAPPGGFHTYVDWPAIIAGGFIATVISFILMTFGSAIGLTLTSPFKGSGISLGAFGVAMGLWVVWVQISSFAAGGYVTGRLRRRLHDATEHESDIRDGLHGALVWALGVLLSAWMAASVASSVVSTTASAVSSVAGGAAAAGAGAAAQSVNPVDYAVDTLFRSDNPQQNAADPAAARQEVTRILERSVSNGSLAPDDKTYLASLIASRTGISQEDAEKRIDQAMASVQDAVAQAKVAADKARRIGIIIAFLTAASLVISGAAAWWAATLGGRHRDEGTDFAEVVRWRRRPAAIRH